MERTAKKMDGLLKAYHRVVQIPLDNVAALSQELKVFGNDVD